MSSNLPEKLLGISIDDAGESPRREDGDADDIELERFLFVELGEQRLAFPIDQIETLTDEPSEVTRIPRSPPAVEGVTDLRGEITVVIDARVHFPVDEPPEDEQKLVVFDRPTDRQSAAIRVDRVAGVEPVPTEHVREEAEVDDRSIAGGALEHPLVVAIVEQERRVEAPTAAADGTSSTADRIGTVELETDATPTGDGATFELAEDTQPDESEPEPESTILVDATAVVDVERLLFASGHVQ